MKRNILYILLGAIAGALLVWFLIPKNPDGTRITNKIDSLHTVIRWKERKERYYRDSIKAKDAAILSARAIVKESEKHVSFVEARVSEWQTRYYALKKLMPQNAKDSLRDLVLSGSACDSLVTELGELSESRKAQVTAITGELKATQAKMGELDSLNLIISSENGDLKKLDSLHTKNERILKKKARRSFLRGTLLGTAIGIVIAIIL